MGAAEREAWVALLRHALTATSARPSGKWLKAAGGLIEAVGLARVEGALARWLPLVEQGVPRRRRADEDGSGGGGGTMGDGNATCLRGLLWCVPRLPGRDALARSLTAVALAAYRKVPGVGPRAFRGLVAPTEAERVLNGGRSEYRVPGGRVVDWKVQFEKAVEAFGRNGFLVLIDDRQARELDEEFVVGGGTRISFVKLTPLVGG